MIRRRQLGITCTEKKVKRYKNDRSIVKEKKPEFNSSEAVQLKFLQLVSVYDTNLESEATLVTMQSKWNEDN